jgi:hypothetical protein
MAGRVWVALPDQLSIRIFFETGIVEGLRAQLDDRIAALFLVRPEESTEWTPRLNGVPVLQGSELTAVKSGVTERALGRVDRWLDRRVGYHPLAIRLNYRHGFHLERMQPGHPNWMLDSARAGSLPRWEALERAMEAWHFGTRRHVPKALLTAMRRDCSALVLSNVQPHSAVPFLVAARRLGVPVVAYVASWDHTVGKGVIPRFCERYVVQNDVMREDLVRYHGVAPERILVTGWPQTDVFHERRPRSEYEALVRGYGLDPERPLVLVMGNTPTNAPGEGRFVERLADWWEASARDRMQLFFRPHPRDRDWRERFAAASGRAGTYVQEPSYTDLAVLAILLQHGDVVVANAGTIMLDAVVNDRPVVCVLYDEGASPAESWAAKNVIGKHYEELASSGAFYRAASFDEVILGIERALANPGELAIERRTVAERVVGEVDGRAAERVVDAIVAVVRSPATVSVADVIPGAGR